MLCRCARILTVTALFFCAAGFSTAQVKQPGGFFAQRFTIAAGASSSLRQENISASAGLLFAPRIFITTTFSDFSASIDPSPQLLYSFSDSPKEKLFFQLPVMLNFNLGHLASKDFYDSYGFFAGGGWNLQYGHGKSSNCLAVDGGIRFWLFGQSFSLAYQRLLSHEKIFSSDHFFFLQI